MGSNINDRFADSFDKAEAERFQTWILDELQLDEVMKNGRLIDESIEQLCKVVASKRGWAKGASFHGIHKFSIQDATPEKAARLTFRKND